MGLRFGVESYGLRVKSGKGLGVFTLTFRCFSAFSAREFPPPYFSKGGGLGGSLQDISMMWKGMKRQLRMAGSLNVLERCVLPGTAGYEPLAAEIVLMLVPERIHPSRTCRVHQTPPEGSTDTTRGRDTRMVTGLLKSNTILQPLATNFPQDRETRRPARPH